MAKYTINNAIAPGTFAVKDNDGEVLYVGSWGQSCEFLLGLVGFPLEVSDELESETPTPAKVGQWLPVGRGQQYVIDARN
jgi:hypothetical protein